MKYGLAVYISSVNTVIIAESNRKKDLEKAGDELQRKRKVRYEVVEMKYHQE